MCVCVCVLACVCQCMCQYMYQCVLCMHVCAWHPVRFERQPGIPMSYASKPRRRLAAGSQAHSVLLSVARNYNQQQSHWPDLPEETQAAPPSYTARQRNTRIYDTFTFIAQFRIRFSAWIVLLFCRDVSSAHGRACQEKRVYVFRCDLWLIRGRLSRPVNSGGYRRR